MSRQAFHITVATQATSLRELSSFELRTRASLLLPRSRHPTANKGPEEILFGPHNGGRPSSGRPDPALWLGPVRGQSRSFGDVASMSELPSRAVVERTSVHGRKVPTAVIAAIRLTEFM